MTPEPAFVQKMKSLEWNRDDFTLEEQWAVAQKWEVEFHLWHITEKKKYVGRTEFVAGKQQLGRAAVAAFGPGYPEALSGHILDVGCGVASVLEGWPGIDVVAIDPNLAAYHKAMPAFALLGHVDNCFYHSCFIEDVSSDNFDIVYSCNVLDHAIGWQDIVGHMHRVLKPGGLLLLTVDVADRRYGGQARRMLHPSIIRYPDLIACIESVGFDIKWHGVSETDELAYRCPVVARRPK